MFVGTPLFAGDLENGTAKLVADQSVSRPRWLAIKVHAVENRQDRGRRRTPSRTL
ncbi:hypothetical protein ACI2L1_39800 [Streptomyces sp. NPDC019531]|uniref:hypothetical protein n=1 Tax=Streptomyces sp. NPDC019531 TaxID=3365062 RepID=UPI00384A875E